MKKIIFLFVSAAGFLLVWAAGHDILSGEQEVWQEYTVVIAGLLLAGYGLISILRKKRIGRAG